MPAREPDSKAIGRAWWGVVVLFLVHGLVVSTWVARIPAVQSALKLPNGVLGLTLLSSAVGAVLSIPFTGWLITRYGSKRVTGISSCLFCMAIVLLGLARNGWALSGSLFVFGVLAAAMDVAMNAQGVEVERQLGAPTMSRFHGMFSLGGMLGAAAGGALATRGVPVVPHFAASAAVNLMLVGCVAPLLLTSDRGMRPGEHRLPLRQTPKVLFALSAIGFCILLSEGAMADWTAVYLKQVLNAGPGRAAAGYAVFSASMALFRFLGDLITTRLGPLTTVRAGSLLAAAGLVWALTMQSPDWSLPGFAAAGAGFSVIIPLVFGAGGRVESVSPGAGIATVTGIGYVGFIVGPPTIGFASQLFTLRFALFIVVACCIVAAVLARFMRGLKPIAPTAGALPVAEIHF